VKAHRIGIAIVLAALGTSVGIAPALASGGLPTGITRDYTLQFHWHGFPGAGTTGLHIYPDGTFTTDDGSVGHWRYDAGTIDLQITVGCRPLYVGHRAGSGLFRGRQLCTDGSGGYGRWRAGRLDAAAGYRGGTSFAP
jgi:hypothetical protein